MTLPPVLFVYLLMEMFALYAKETGNNARPCYCNIISMREECGPLCLRCSDVWKHGLFWKESVVCVALNERMRRSCALQVWWVFSVRVIYYLYVINLCKTKKCTLQHTFKESAYVKICFKRIYWMQCFRTLNWKVFAFKWKCIIVNIYLEYN